MKYYTAFLKGRPYCTYRRSRNGTERRFEPYTFTGPDDDWEYIPTTTVAELYALWSEPDEEFIELSELAMMLLGVEP